jgi:hypothetical protein
MRVGAQPRLLQPAAVPGTDGVFSLRRPAKTVPAPACRSRCSKTALRCTHEHHGADATRTIDDLQQTRSTSERNVLPSTSVVCSGPVCVFWELAACVGQVAHRSGMRQRPARRVLGHQRGLAPCRQACGGTLVWGSSAGALGEIVLWARGPWSGTKWSPSST